MSLPSLVRSASHLAHPRLPTYLVLFVTKRCNAACSFCFYPINTDPDTLSLDEITLLMKRYPRFKQVTLSGGEPYLRADLAELITIIHRVGGARFVTVSSNGSLPVHTARTIESVLASCPDLHYRASLSVDDLPEQHDRVRKIPGLFERIRETYGELVRLAHEYPGKVELNVQTVLSGLNKNRIAAVREMVEREFPLCRRSLVLARGEVPDPDALDVSADEYEQASMLWSEGGSERSLWREPYDAARDAILSYEREVITEILRTNRPALPCTAGRKLVVVDTNGDVLPCEMRSITRRTIGRDVLGNLRKSDYDLKRILLEKDVKRAVDRIKSNGCHCTFECALNASIAFRPDALATALVRHAAPRITRRTR
jgi:MoaA/NifB/PqqE/SkfB family radical SAM enzyme